MTGLFFAAAAVFIGGFLLEKRTALQDRSRLAHVIHVNGTRGKSSVSRLIEAGLRAGGLRVYCKTTGTLPMTINVAGNETLIRRAAPSNIREQLRILHKAAAQGAEVLVAECMAITPKLQSVAQHEMLRADIGVITNVRIDHTDVMGETLEEICNCLCSTVPVGGTLFTAETALRERMRQNAEAQNCRFFAVEPKGDEPDFDFGENIALALAVCQHLGVDRETALSGMAAYHPDPYALSFYRLGGVHFVNALSANDIQSTRMIYRQVLSTLPRSPQRTVLLVNNRMDRGSRTRSMAELACTLSSDEVWLLGSGQDYFLRTLRRGGYRGPVTKLKSAGDADFAALPDHTLVFAAGNIAGEGKNLLARVEEEGERLVR